MLFFHTPVASTKTTTQPVPKAVPTHRTDERYQCSRCGYPSSSVYVIKKHIIFKHLDHLARQFIGQSTQANGGKIYFCKVCKMNTGSLDYMLHHMLVEPIHYWVNAQVQSLISENKRHNMKPTPNGNGLFVTFPGLAPKPPQPQAISNGRLVLSNNGQPPGTMLTLQQLQGAPSGTTLICAPGTNQAFLPPQASALVQLASAEAKGLLQPGATISLQSALPQGPSMVQLPTTSNAPLKPVPLALASAPTFGQPPQNPQAKQVFLPPGVQVTMAGLARSGSQPVIFTTALTTQTTPQGTMLTSQSLLNHLIPTGNRVNGMPTYTFAPLNVTMSNGQSAATHPQLVKPASISSPQTKKWTTCPLCNELFPSNVFDMHTEVAHRTKSITSRHESVAARAPFLRKMPDKTVKCLMCKVLLSSKGLFEHLLHGLSCLYCSALFYSIKQLIEHVKSHNPSNKAYCDFLRQEYRVYTNGGKLLFPYFDINTTAPKEILGDTELNLALVTNSLDLIFLKMLPSNHLDICKTPSKINSAYCPFCDETFQNEAKHLQHLKQKHFVAPTIHAILKTEAFKCIYCNGVYTGKVTQQAVMLHIQRCRCSPKKQTEAPKMQESHDLKGRGQQLKPTQPQINQPPGLYFLQMPQARPTIPIPTPTLSRTLAPARAPVPTHKPSVEPPETEAELQSKKRLEAAWKEVVQANKREREERLAMRKKREQERLAAAAAPPPEVPSDPAVKLALKPSPTERRCAEERKDFISRYFHINPYITKKETDELCKKLSLTKGELAAHFGNKRTKCMRSIQKNTAAVLLGFNMTELSKLKHNLLIPEVQPAEPLEQTDMPTAEPEPVEESGDSEKIMYTEQKKDNQSEEMEESEMGNGDSDKTTADADETANVDVSEKVAETAES